MAIEKENPEPNCVGVGKLFFPFDFQGPMRATQMPRKSRHFAGRLTLSPGDPIPRPFKNWRWKLKPKKKKKINPFLFFFDSKPRDR
jgi:hypothetical protein